MVSFIRFISLILLLAAIAFFVYSIFLAQRAVRERRGII